MSLLPYGCGVPDFLVRLHSDTSPGQHDELRRFQSQGALRKAVALREMDAFSVKC